MDEDKDPPNDVLRKEIRECDKQLKADEKTHREERIRVLLEKTKSVKNSLRRYNVFNESEISELMNVSTQLFKKLIALLEERRGNGH